MELSQAKGFCRVNNSFHKQGGLHHEDDLCLSFLFFMHIFLATKHELSFILILDLKYRMELYYLFQGILFVLTMFFLSFCLQVMLY